MLFLNLSLILELWLSVFVLLSYSWSVYRLRFDNLGVLQISCGRRIRMRVTSEISKNLKPGNPNSIIYFYRKTKDWSSSKDSKCKTWFTTFLTESVSSSVGLANGASLKDSFSQSLKIFEKCGKEARILKKISVSVQRVKKCLTK